MVAMRRLSVAVSGASGFVGRHVVKALDACDVEITLLSRDASSVDSMGASAAAPGSHRVVPWDVHRPREDAFDRIGRPDVLIHLAWGGLPNYRSPHHVDQELPAQRAMLDALIGGGLRTLVVSGTCFEYGMHSGELTEDMPAAPDNAYAVAKDGLRQHLQARHADACKPALALTWARLFYLYGEGQSASALWSQLSKAADRNDAEFPMSGGEQIRDFMPIEQAARELVALALDGRHHDIVNLCSGVPTTVRARVERWIDEHGWTIKPALGRYPYPDHEPMAFWGSRTKLDAALHDQDNRVSQPRP